MPPPSVRPGDAGVADDPAGSREAERLALTIEVLVEAAPFETNGARDRIDA